MLTASERYALLERAEELLAERRYSDIIRLLQDAEKEFQAEPMLAALLASSYAFSLRVDEATRLITWLKSLRVTAMHPKLHLRVVNAEGVLEFERGNLRKAWSICSSVLAGASVLNEELFVASSYLNLANIYCIRGCYDDALSHYHRAWQAYLRVGSKNHADVCYQNLGLCYRWIGMYQTADEHFAYATISAKKRRSSYDLASALVERAILKGLQEDIRVGELLAAEAYQISLTEDYYMLQAESLRALGTLRNLANDWSGALEFIDRARGHRAASAARLLSAEVYEQEAVAARGLGNEKRAIASAIAAWKLYAEMDAVYHCERVATEFDLPAGVEPEL